MKLLRYALSKRGRLFFAAGWQAVLAVLFAISLLQALVAEHWLAALVSSAAAELFAESAWLLARAGRKEPAP